MSFFIVLIPSKAEQFAPIEASVVPRKQELFDNADKVNRPLLRLVRLITTLLSLSILAVVIGACLAFAWARRVELTTLRALGFVRSELLGFFALEAWILAVLSAVIGSVLGTALAWLAFPSGAVVNATSSTDLAPKISRLAGVTGFSGGFTVVLLTIMVSLSTASMGTVADGFRKRMGMRAQGRKPSRRSLIVSVFGLAPLALFGMWTLIHGLGTFSPFPLLVALGTFGAIVYRTIRNFRPSFPARKVVAVVVGTVALFGPFAWPHVFKRLDTGSVVLQALLLSVAGIALFVPWMGRITQPGPAASTDAEPLPPGIPATELTQARRRGSVAVRRLLSSAYLRRPMSRTNGVRFLVSLLTMSLFSVVLLRSSLATSLQAAGRSTQQSWQGVIISPTADIEQETQSVVDRFGLSAPVAVLAVDGSVGSQPIVDGELSVIERSFVESTPPVLQRRLVGVPDDQAVWDRVVSGDGVVMVRDALANGSSRTREAKVGDSVSLVDRATGRSVTAPILGVASALPGMGSVVAGPKIAQSLFAVTPGANHLFVRSQPDQVLDVASLSLELSARGLGYETLNDRLASTTASTRRVLRLLQWLAGIIGLAGFWSFLASRAQLNADRASSFASLRAIGADSGVGRGIVRSELIGLIVPGVLVGLLCAFVLTFRVVWSGGLGPGANFGVDPATFLSAVAMLGGSLVLGVVLLSRNVTKIGPVRGLSTRRVS